MPLSVTLLYFAGVRDFTGTPSEDVLLNGETVANARAYVAERYPLLAPNLDRVRIARNERFAEDDAALQSGDRIAFIPPVSGG